MFGLFEKDLASVSKWPSTQEEEEELTDCPSSDDEAEELAEDPPTKVSDNEADDSYHAQDAWEDFLEKSGFTDVPRWSAAVQTATDLARAGKGGRASRAIT